MAVEGRYRDARLPAALDEVDDVVVVVVVVADASRFVADEGPAVPELAMEDGDDERGEAGRGLDQRRLVAGAGTGAGAGAAAAEEEEEEEEVGLAAGRCVGIGIGLTSCCGGRRRRRWSCWSCLSCWPCRPCESSSSSLFDDVVGLYVGVLAAFALVVGWSVVLVVPVLDVLVLAPAAAAAAAATAVEEEGWRWRVEVSCDDRLADSLLLEVR